jgi:hypothetical protein
MKRLARVFALAVFLALPQPASAQMVNATQFTQFDRNDPLAVSNVSMGPATASSLRVCFAFRNLTSKDVTSAQFHFVIQDQFGADRLSANFIRNANGVFPSGSITSPPNVGPGFTDTNSGSQSCWTMPATLNDLNGLSNGSKIVVTVTGVAFADGSRWTRGATFPRAFNFDGTAFFFTPPQFSTSWTTEQDSAPVVVIAAGVRSLGGSDPKMEQCISFRTTTNKPATSIFFRYLFRDANNVPVPGQNWHWIATGTFTPPILIADKCWTGALAPAATIANMRSEVISVEEVTFADGSQWKRGMPYFKAFAANGSPYSGPQPVVASVVPGPGGSLTPAPSQTPSGFGGTIGPSGQQFGEIAWIVPTSAGQTTLVTGSAVDKPTLFEAQHGAMEACEANAVAQSQDKARCTLLIQGRGLNSATTRCAVLGLSGARYDVGLGRTLDDADLDLINKIRAAGGSIEGIRYTVKVCNTQ